MSNAIPRLIKEMKESVTVIDKLLDQMLRVAAYSSDAAINKNNRFIQDKILEIYDKLVELKEVEAITHKRIYEDKITQSNQIKIDISGDQILIKMGRLPGKRDNPKMIVNELNEAFLWSIKEGNEMPRVPKIVIQVTHVYPTDFPAKSIKDNDNYNYKAIINTICRFTTGSDKGDNCWLSFRTKVAADYTLGTEIKVYPQRE